MTSPTPSAEGIRVLVAEDEPHIRRVLVAVLESGGYRVEAVADGAAARSRLEGPDPFDLILLDILMPGASGLSVLSHLRTLEHRSGTPVVILTAKGQDADRTEAFSLGASGFITKPFSPKKLLAELHDLLSRD